MRTLKYILLPILGALAAVLAFRLAAPYEGTLNRSYLGDDPRALFTWGTKWGEVNRIAFGALLCGPFAVVLSLGRRSVLHVVIAGLVGAVLGGFINFITDSSSDLIGLALSGRSAQFGSLMAMFAWCFLVPVGVAFTIVIAQGVTPQRIRRAMYAVKITAVASFCVQIIGGMLAAQDGDESVNLQSQVPVWRLVEIAVGVAFGVTMVVADEWVRAGTVRLVHGRNEFVDWSLDHAISRIGSAEGCEIYIRGKKGVEPMHAAIVRRGDSFVLDAQAPTLVNGLSVTQVALKSNDEITMGDAKLVFTIGGSSYVSSPFAPSYAQSQPYIQQQPYVQPQPYTQQPYVQSQPIYMSSQPQPKILQDTAGRQIPLQPGKYTVGSDQSSAFCLFNDPQISPNHAEILVTDTGLHVTDLGTHSGTKINGNQINSPTSLRPGDTLEFGATRFTFVG